MATAKNLTPAETKTAIATLKAELKTHKASLKPFESDVKAAVKGLAAFKKSVEKQIAASQKLADNAHVKLLKAEAAVAKHEERITAQLEKLQPAAPDAA